MRISTSLFYSQGTSQLLDKQSALAEQQLKLASGKRILSPSEDPAASVQTLALTSAIDRTQQLDRNANFAESRLGFEESVLAEITETFQRVRELTIQAANASQTDATRRDIGAEVEQRLEQLVELGNARDGNGDYLFAGFSTDQRPFTRTATGVRFDGDSGEREVAIGSERTVQVGDSGRALFMDLPDGNGTFTVTAAAANTGAGVLETGTVLDPALYDGQPRTIEFTAPDTFRVLDGAGAVVATGLPFTADRPIEAIPGIEVTIDGAPATGDRFEVQRAGDRSVFDVVEDLLGALRAGSPTDADAAAFQTEMNRALTGLDIGLGHVQDARATVGARLQIIDSQRAVNSSVSLRLESSRSELADLDYVSAIGEFQQQLQALEAARASFARVQNLSLFDFIR